MKKQTIEHEGDSDTNCNWRAQNNSESIGTGTGRLRNKRKSGVHPNYCIIKIGQNTEKSTGDLRRLAVTQIPNEFFQYSFLHMNRGPHLKKGNVAHNILKRERV